MTGIMADDGRLAAGQEMQGRSANANLREAVKLTVGFWASRRSLRVWPLLVVMTTIQFVGVYSWLMKGDYQKALFDMIAVRAFERWPEVLRVFGTMTGLTMILGIVTTLALPTIVFEWRRWLTDRYVGRWLGSGAYYGMERTGLIDNPDQRIAEDLNLLPNQILNFCLSGLSAVVGAVTFGTVLWKASGPGVFSLGGATVHIPGYLFWGSSCYILLSTALTFWIARKLPRLTILQQRFEADFRFKLIQIRRSAEQIALLRGEQAEQETVSARFIAISRNFYSTLWQQVKIATFGAFQGGFGDIVPILLMLPLILAGALTVGSVMQLQTNMQNYSGSLAYFMTAAAAIQTMRGQLARIRTLDVATAEPLRQDAVRTPAGAGEAIRVEDVRVGLPDGTLLLALDRWSVARGERWLVKGPSGCGKSTLMHAVAGIWPETSGRITTVPDNRMMFLPQRPYLPVGTLRHAITFPYRDGIDDEHYLADLLHKVGLGAVADQLDVSAEWDRRLSLGEQQRLSFLRVLLMRPDLVILDESTSALDPENATLMYRMLLDALPDVTVVSVAHSDVLDAFHSDCLDLGGHSSRSGAKDA